VFTYTKSKALPPPALSPGLLDRRSAPCRPVANASIYPRTCHAVCVLLRSSAVAHPGLWRTRRASSDTHTPRQILPPSPSGLRRTQTVSSVRPTVSLRRSTATRPRSRRGGPPSSRRRDYGVACLCASRRFPRLGFPPWNPLSEAPLSKRNSTRGKTHPGTTAQASFCLEVARPAGGRSHSAAQPSPPAPGEGIVQAVLRTPS